MKLKQFVIPNSAINSENMRACHHFQNPKTSINHNKLTIGTKTLYTNIKLNTYGQQKTHLKFNFP